MDDLSFSKKANISVISRFDQQVKDIVISASQVALYVFDAKKTKWIKRNVEGACFFYKRKTSPKYGIFILNRLDTTNFIELMNSTMDLQLQEPFILYRNIFKTIYGIWFYDKKECTEMASVFQKILNELKDKEKAEQEEDDHAVENPIKEKLPTTEYLRDQQMVEDNLLVGKEEKPGGQPESVRQFFAIASKEATKNQPGLQASPAQQGSCNKSLCNSFQSVAHIEKKLEPSPFQSSSADNLKTKNDFVLPIARRDDELLRSENNVHIIDSGFKAINLANCFESSPVNSVPQNSIFADEINPTDSEFPELLLPKMLITPSDLSASLQNAATATSETDSYVKLKNDVLSKNQMIQAMEYLLKNDSQFVDKLYDAYLKSSKKF